MIPFICLSGKDGTIRQQGLKVENNLSTKVEQVEEILCRLWYQLHESIHMLELIKPNTTHQEKKKKGAIYCIMILKHEENNKSLSIKMVEADKSAVCS